MRLAFISIITLILIALGLSLHRGEILILALPFVLFLTAQIYFSLNPQNISLSAKRTLSAKRVCGKDEVKVALEIQNQGARLEEVQLVDDIPEGLKIIEGDTSLIASLEAGEKVSLEYTVTANRGRFSWPSIKVVASDHLGGSIVTFELPCPQSLFVLPPFEELRDIEIRPRRTKVYSGVVKARLGGPGVEFFGTREYYPGDPFKWIDWNATARQGKPITIEFEQERVADVGLILDARERSDVYAKAESLFEHSVRAAASLARFFIKQGNNVGLLIYGRYLDWNFPGYGKLQLEKLMRALAGAQKGHKAVFEELEAIPKRLFPVRSQIVLVSPLLPGDFAALRNLRALYSVIVISPNPIDFELQGLKDKDSDAIQLAARIARLQRRVMLNKLRRAGIRVADWDVTKPLVVEAKRNLSRVRR